VGASTTTSRRPWAAHRRNTWTRWPLTTATTSKGRCSGRSATTAPAASIRRSSLKTGPRPGPGQARALQEPGRPRADRMHARCSCSTGSQARNCTDAALRCHAGLTKSEQRHFLAPVICTFKQGRQTRPANKAGLPTAAMPGAAVSCLRPQPRHPEVARHACPGEGRGNTWTVGRASRECLDKTATRRRRRDRVLELHLYRRRHRPSPISVRLNNRCPMHACMHGSPIPRRSAQLGAHQLLRRFSVGAGRRDPRPQTSAAPATFSVRSAAALFK
jgi:hypothetical protein